MENNKVPLYKRKVLVIPLAMLFTVALISAAVIFASSHATVTVTEALNATLTIAIAPAGYPGETISRDINITSLGNVDLPIEIAWIIGDNPDLVEYSYTGPTIDTIEPGNNTLTLTWDITTGSPAGIFEGDITLTRI